MGTKARMAYIDISDPRGGSDADEQLGLISLANGDVRAASFHLESSLVVRQSLGNQHGVASSLRRLALVHFRSGALLRGLYYLLRSMFLYWRLGVLTSQRMRAIFKELSRWLVRT